MLPPMSAANREATLAQAAAWNEGHRLRVYRAENLAAHLHYVDLLDGSLQAAQEYCDRICRSAWWGRNYKPGPNVLPRVIVLRGRNGGGAAFRGAKVYRRYWHPHIRLGTAECTAAGRPAIADPWVILHELAHIMSGTDESGHGREFARCLMLLVRRWLGPDAAAALREGYTVENVKYRAR